MSELVMERITENLVQLRLSRIQELLETIAEEAQRRSETYLAFLDRLLQEEVTAKEDRRVKTSLKIAGLPFDKTIEEYDFGFHEALDKRSVMSLFDLDFIGRKENGPGDQSMLFGHQYLPRLRSSSVSSNRTPKVPHGAGATIETPSWWSMKSAICRSAGRMRTCSSSLSAAGMNGPAR